jgi:hypothetical protein
MHDVRELLKNVDKYGVWFVAVQVCNLNHSSATLMLFKDAVCNRFFDRADLLAALSKVIDTGALQEAVRETYGDGMLCFDLVRKLLAEKYSLMTGVRDVVS